MPDYFVLSPDHLDRVVALEHSIFAGKERYSPESLQRFCEAGRGVVAVEGAEIVGCVLHKDTMLCWPFGGQYADDDEKSTTVVSLAVAAEHRRRGVAETLMKMTLAAAGSAVYLHVRASNQPAQCLYEKLGFKMVDVLEDYYEAIEGGADGESGIYMRRG